MITGTLRVFTGIALAFLTYQAALYFATGDCASLQVGLREKGPIALGAFLSVAALLTITGIPIAVISAAAGMLLGPISGGSVASTAVSVASITSWYLARKLYMDRDLPALLEQSVTKPWFNKIMNEKTQSGFHWVTKSASICPLPFPYFSALLGVKVRHLSGPAIVAGVFVSSFLHVAAYSLAGGSIGCAVMNHAVGVDISQYKFSIIVSCVFLILLARMDRSPPERN